MAEPWLIRFLHAIVKGNPFSFFFFFFFVVGGGGGGGDFGGVRALNVTVPLGSGPTISGTGRFGLQFEPVQTSNLFIYFTLLGFSVKRF